MNEQLERLARLRVSELSEENAKLAKELELFTAQHAQLCDDYEDLKVERDECCAATAKLREELRIATDTVRDTVRHNNKLREELAEHVRISHEWRAEAAKLREAGQAVIDLIAYDHGGCLPQDEAIDNFLAALAPKQE